MARTSFPLSATEVLLINSLSALGDTGVNQALKKSGNSIVNANITGSLTYQGTWNATTNTPAIASGVGTLGYYYYVSVAGTTNIDGITDWQVGDMLLFNGTVWQKIDNTDAVTSVAGKTGAVTLNLDDLTDVAITGVGTGDFLRYNGTNFVNTTIGASDIPSGIDATKIGNGDVTNTELSYIANATGTTGTGNIVFSATPTLTGGILFSDSVSSVSTNTSDGSDSKAITIAGGGAYGPTRGSGIAVIGNEYATIGGDLELMAGDSAVSGMIKFYVGDGAGNALLAGSIARTSMLTTFNGSVVANSTLSVASTLTVGGQATATSVGIELGNYSGGTPFIDFKSSNVDYNVRIINGTSTSLSFLGGTGGYGFDGPFVLTGDHAVGSISTSSRIQNNATNGLILQGAGATNDLLVVNSAGSNVFRIPVAGTNVRFYAAPEPSSNDGAAIGSASRSFSDGFWAAGAVQNYNNGDYTITHSTGNLTFSGTLTLTATKQLVSSASIYNYVDLSNASGNLVASSRGSIFLDVDADNNSTSNVLFVRFNSATYTGIFEEDGSLTLGNTAKAGTGAFYCGGIAVMNNGNATITNTNESTTLTNFTQSLTNAGLLINTEYTTNAYTPGLFWATSNDNATKPKAGVFMQETGSGTYILLGTSNAYATGIVNTVSVGPDGDIAANRYSATSTATTQNVIFAQSDSLTTGKLGYFYSNSGDTNSRSLVSIVNDSSAATGTTALTIQQDANAGAMTITSANTTTSAFQITASSLTSGRGAYVYSNSSSSSQFVLLDLTSANASATGMIPLAIANAAPTSTNYFRMAYFAGNSGGNFFWKANGVTPNGNLSGNVGDICFGADSGKAYYCTGTTNWTAM